MSRRPSAPKILRTVQHLVHLQPRVVMFYVLIMSAWHYTTT